MKLFNGTPRPVIHDQAFILDYWTTELDDFVYWPGQKSFTSWRFYVILKFL